MANEEELEEEFIQLAKRGPRRVQSPEGAKFYGLPIGSVITADLIKKKRAEAKSQGKPAPQGGLSGGSSVGSSGSGGADTSKSPAMADLAETGVQFKKSTLSGPNGFAVGSSQYSAPAGSKLIKVKNNSGFVYVLTPDKKVSAFTEEGEADVPEFLAPILADKFKSLKANDPQYELEEFSDAQEPQLAKQKPGATLNKNGAAVFTKTGDGAWENTDLGIVLTDDDLQSAYDEGTFELKRAEVKDVDLSKLTEEELAAALKAYPDGHQLGAGSKATLTKSGDVWVSNVTGAGTDSDTLAGMAVNTSFLSQNLPNAPEPENTDKKKEENPDPLQDPDEPVTPDNELKRTAKKNLADGAVVKSAEDGDTLYHDTLGPITKIYSEDQWATLDGENIYSSNAVAGSANVGHVSISPWNTKQEEDFNLYMEALAVPEEEVKKPLPPENAATPEDVKSAALGSTVEHSYSGLLTLDDEGVWVDEEGEPVFSSDELVDETEAGLVTDFSSAAPEPEDIPDPAPVEDKKPGSMSTEQVEDAVKSLEDHTGFQIAYGLKALPEDHPLKDKEYLDSLVAEAKTAYPSVSPKKAFVQFLKDGIGAPDAPEEKSDSADTEDSGPQILIGSESAKKTQTGMTGGSFSQKDIQEAIDILENFQGKVFKSELNKKGNPLGQLSPNDIVGFNKDKTVTKQKFLDLLKSKVANSEDEKVSDVAPEVDDQPLEDWEVELLNSTVPGNNPVEDLVLGDVIEGTDQMSYMPAGTVLQWGNPEYPDASHTYTKNASGNWDSSTGAQDIGEGSFFGAIQSKFLTYKNGPEEKKVVLEPGDVITSVEMLEALETGSTVQGSTLKYVKNKDGEFNFINPNGLPSVASYTAEDFEGLISKGAVKFDSAPGAVHKEDAPGIEAENPDAAYSEPTYVQAPSSASSQVGVEESKPLTYEDLSKMPGLKMFKHSSKNIVYQKLASGSYTGYELDQNAVWELSADAMEVADEGTFLSLPEPQNPHKLYPGKFTKGGKTFLYVNEDGTGVYKGYGNKTTALDVAGVKKKWDEGFNLYVIDKSGAPTVSTEESLAASPSTKKSVGNISDLPDGKYFVGNPNSPKAQVFEVVGDEVLHTKPLTEWDGTKLGQKPTAEFLETAPVGTKIESKYFGDTLTKAEDGSWVKEDGSTSSTPSGWTLSKYKIAGLGNKEAVSVKKSSLKTKFLTGKLVDSTGTSVLPKNYSGTLFWFGAETNAITLLNAKEKLASEDTKFGTVFNQVGLAGMDATLAKKKVLESYDEYSAANVKEYFLKHIDATLNSLDTNVPDTDTTKLFQFDNLGYAQPPEGLLNMNIPSYYYTTDASASAIVKSISAMFGDGTVIGQVPGTMDKSDKLAWAEAVQAGDFQKAYNLEFNAAVIKGKSLPQGYKHPGYPDNSETHKMKWSAAVPGEVPAGVTVEGKWSDSTLDWSMAEVDNYLIKAQMQNPTYLTSTQKASWVKYHLSGDKDNTDNYSLHAKSKAEDGGSPKSDPPQWTDDIKPVKVYDSLFVDTEYPLNWTGYSSQKAALAWYEDNKAAIPELEANAKTFMEDTWGSYVSTQAWEDLGLSYKQATASSVVQQYFQKKHDAYEAEKLIPVYTKEAGQTKGSHPGAFYTDQFGNKFYAKWWDYEDQLSNYRLEIEHAGNLIGKAFGFKTANSILVTQDGHYMQLQSKVDGIGDLTGFDYSTISSTMLADIEGEHMLDWLLQNDDTKADNAIVTASGNVVGIDKARSFKDYGAVDWNHDAPDGNLSIYTRLYDAIQSGDVSKETLDAAYAKVMKTAKRMQKASDQKFFDLIEAGSANRPGWTIGYEIDGSPVSQDVEGLKAAFADQKSKLVAKVESEWAKLYKSAGHGDLPELVEPTLGEGVISGLENPELHEQVFAAKASGKTAMIGGAQVIGGTVLVWNEQDKQGTQNVMGEMFLAPKAQTSALSFFTNYTAEKAVAVTSTSFGQYDLYQNSLLSAAKTVNQHFEDKAYNANTISEFTGNLTLIQMELDEWAPNLQPNAKKNGLDAYMFKTGRTVPMEHLAQYKLMLEYYNTKYTSVKNAYDKQEKTPMVSAYSIIEPASQTETLTSPDGSMSVVSMADGKWLMSSSTGVSLVSLGQSELDSLKEQGYVSSLKVGEPKDSTPMGATFSLNEYTHERTGSFDLKTNTKTVDSNAVDSGANGQEYQVTLPTGEKIFWRNSDHTQTARGQQGKLVFQLTNTADSSAVAASMARVQEFLSLMGVDNHASTHTDAELTYWREMYSVLENRNHDEGNSQKFGKVYAKMNQKVAELATPPEFFLENLSASMTPDEEVEYWRDLWSTEFADKVSDFVASEGYLPKFDHQNVQDAELTTGKPYWERFDVTFEDIMAKDVWLAHSSGNTPGNLGEIESGGLLSGEERIRQLGKIFTGGGYGSGSPLSDQNNGSSHQIYTRLVKSSDVKNYNYILSPSLLLRTRTYVLTGDQYGKLDSRKTDTQSDLMDLIDTHTGMGGELMTPHMASVLDGIEFMVFSEGDESKRETQIQKLKAMGLETIRGLPIEDRLIMRVNLQASIEKVKKAWKQNN